MKKAQIILIVLIFASPVCLASDDHYVSIQVGGSMPTNKVDVREDPQNPFTARLKSSPVFGASIGTRVYNNLFAELEYAYTPNYSFSKSYSHGSGVELMTVSTAAKIRSHSFFANLNYLIKHNSLPFTPYLTVGAGLANNRLQNVPVTTAMVNDDSVARLFKGQNKTSFAWQAGAGCLFPLNEKLELNVAIKYQNLGKIQSSAYDLNNQASIASIPVKARLSTVNLMFGLKYKF